MFSPICPQHIIYRLEALLSISGDYYQVYLPRLFPGTPAY